MRRLDGPWAFRLTDRPEAALTAVDRVTCWRTVEVPSLWTMTGDETPHYTNVVMPFDTKPPTVSSLEAVCRVAMNRITAMLITDRTVTSL